MHYRSVGNTTDDRRNGGKIGNDRNCQSSDGAKEYANRRQAMEQMTARRLKKGEAFDAGAETITETAVPRPRRTRIYDVARRLNKGSDFHADTEALTRNHGPKNGAGPSVLQAREQAGAYMRRIQNHTNSEPPGHGKTRAGREMHTGESAIHEEVRKSTRANVKDLPKGRGTNLSAESGLRIVTARQCFIARTFSQLASKSCNMPQDTEDPNWAGLESTNETRRTPVTVAGTKAWTVAVERREAPRTTIPTVAQNAVDSGGVVREEKLSLRHSPRQLNAETLLALNDLLIWFLLPTLSVHVIRPSTPLHAGDLRRREGEGRETPYR
ncbi:hypothetical protein R3P38DRAFT_2759328 [Favolaschia claudopus]|uniref:Uncharacterized protein n=1 Tax=Favolaschia claudopus TaxID=2862362 RepID=A0AAW0E6Z7_9AGAR